MRDENCWTAVQADIEYKKKRRRRAWALVALGGTAYAAFLWLVVKTSPTDEDLRRWVEEDRAAKIEECRAACSDPYCTVSFNPISYEDINCVCTCDQFAEEVD